jgi:hypothetical protein
MQDIRTDPAIQFLLQPLEVPCVNVLSQNVRDFIGKGAIPATCDIHLMVRIGPIPQLP